MDSHQEGKVTKVKNKKSRATQKASRAGWWMFFDILARPPGLGLGCYVDLGLPITVC